MTDTTTKPALPAFKKVVSPGSNKQGDWPTGRLWIEIRYDNEMNPTKPFDLAITGVEGPRKNGNAKGSCGQCRDALDRVDDLSPGWTAEMIARLRETWDRWHLNGMQAGSARQMQWLRDNPITAVYPESHYDKAKSALREAWLQPDLEHEVLNSEGVNIGYSYGSAWLHEDVPDEVLIWLHNLPRGTIAEYPWRF